MIYPSISLMMGNNTLWLGNAGLNVVGMGYNVSVRMERWNSDAVM
jgi:hypothetical protein